MAPSSSANRLRGVGHSTQRHGTERVTAVFGTPVGPAAARSAIEQFAALCGPARAGQQLGAQGSARGDSSPQSAATRAEIRIAACRPTNREGKAPPCPSAHKSSTSRRASPLPAWWAGRRGQGNGCTASAGSVGELTTWLGLVLLAVSGCRAAAAERVQIAEAARMVRRWSGSQLCWGLAGRHWPRKCCARRGNITARLPGRVAALAVVPQWGSLPWRTGTHDAACAAVLCSSGLPNWAPTAAATERLLAIQGRQSRALPANNAAANGAPDSTGERASAACPARAPL